MKVLVTGGAGYIGSHICKYLLEQGHDVVVIDNLQSSTDDIMMSLQEQYPKHMTFYQEDIINKNALDKSLENEARIDVVFHLASLIYVDESTKKPYEYYKINVMGTLNILQIMVEHQIKNIVFSSTAAIYGHPDYVPISEDHPIRPQNPYAESKYISERLIQSYSEMYDMTYLILRYFNVVGAWPDGSIGDSRKPQKALLQNAVLGALNKKQFFFTHSRTETEDGSPIRDYIDVNDIVDAHDKSLTYLQETNDSEIINLGTGKGYSVKSVVAKVEKVCGKDFQKKQAKKVRNGEIDVSYASNKKAYKLLKWQPQKSIVESVKSLKKYYSNED